MLEASMPLTLREINIRKDEETIIINHCPMFIMQL